MNAIRRGFLKLRDEMRTPASSIPKPPVTAMTRAHTIARIASARSRRRTRTRRLAINCIRTPESYAGHRWPHATIPARDRMSKKSKPRRRANTRPETHALRQGPNWALLALSSLGIALTGYLSWTAFSGGAVQGCAAGGGCDAVLTSRWATLLGLPTALWGLFAYTALAAIAFVRRADRHWSYAWTAAFFGVCYSVYLTVVSLTVLESACPYCLTSLALMSAILALVVCQRPPEMAHRSWVGLAAGRGALA